MSVTGSVWVIAGLMVLAILFLMSVLAKLYRKAGPHEALVVYGFRGTRIIKGHGTVIFPMIETCRGLSLELMSFDVAPQQDLYTRQGVAVTVEAVAQIKVKSDPESIQTASEQFLTKNPAEREGLIRLVMEGHLRGIIGQLAVEEIVKQPEMVAERMRSTCAEDMNKMGLEVISFTIKEVRDKNEYITNMGRPDIVRIKRDADVAAAEAERDTAIKRAEATRAAAVAKAQADQERVMAETLSAAKQAEAQRDLEIKKANYKEMTTKQQAQADKAYELQTNVMQQLVIAEAVKIKQIEKEQEIKVQEAEILRHERELIAQVLKQAEVEKRRIETLAEAEKQRLVMEAEGHAAATRAQGEAEAEIIFKKGEAEAKAMNVKAEAYQEYNQAAVVDKLITSLPEVVRALAAPLANVDKITVVSTGNGTSAGMNKVTGDIVSMAAQIPALFETLSGLQMSELFSKIRQIGDRAPKPDGPAAASADAPPQK
ncbi:MAG: flotillin [Acidobacteria bacterium 13_1_20CM_2_57_8]|nr:MAG: flotillin [Acidobacteria bacterium 13_1_20CM_2_57_8]PYS26914.1 MAG: flotillin [Acidobacteriota bacterium]